VWRFLGVGARRRLRPSDRVAQLTAGARAGARLVVVVGREELRTRTECNFEAQGELVSRCHNG
jgi:hypothetical protein